MTPKVKSWLWRDSIPCTSPQIKIAFFNTTTKTALNTAHYRVMCLALRVPVDVGCTRIEPANPFTWGWDYWNKTGQATWNQCGSNWCGWMGGFLKCWTTLHGLVLVFANSQADLGKGQQRVERGLESLSSLVLEKLFLLRSLFLSLPLHDSPIFFQLISGSHFDPLQQWTEMAWKFWDDIPWKCNPTKQTAT